ncbi:MAG: cytochrome c [Rhodospirillales bacterium]|nr:cytochrome c [Rhodospirillales bacterium]
MTVLVMLGIAAIFAPAALATNHAKNSAGAVPGGIGLGKALFNKNCASCHGVSLKGTENGPPFLHRFYHPGHHADGSFFIAVTRGVRQHHWKFGNMEPLPGVSRPMITSIVKYVRYMQKQAGIF